MSSFVRMDVSFDIIVSMSGFVRMDDSPYMLHTILFVCQVLRGWIFLRMCRVQYYPCVRFCENRRFFIYDVLCIVRVSGFVTDGRFSLYAESSFLCARFVTNDCFYVYVMSLSQTHQLPDSVTLHEAYKLTILCHSTG